MNQRLVPAMLLALSFVTPLAWGQRYAESEEPLIPRVVSSSRTAAQLESISTPSGSLATFLATTTFLPTPKLQSQTRQRLRFMLKNSAATTLYCTSVISQ